MSTRSVFLRGVRERYGAKLALAFLAIIALVVAFGTVVHFQTAEQLRTDVREELKTTSGARADELDAWLASVKTGARLTSAHPTLREGDPAAIGAYLDELMADGKVPAGVVAVHYMDATEMRIVASSAEGFVGVSPAEQGAAFAEDPPSFEGTDDVHVSDPFTVPIVDFPVVAVISPVADRPGRMVIYMVNLEKRLASFADDDGAGFTAVVNADGRYVAHPDRGKILTEHEQTGGTEGAFSRALGGEIAFESSGDDLEAYAPMESTDWVVVVHRQKAEAYALGSQVTADILGLILLAVISLALVGVTIGSNTVISLRQLSSKADRMAGGDLDVEFDRTRNDEFGTLVQSFADMRDSLAEKISEVEEAREEAERRREEAEAMTENLEEKAAHYEEVMVDCAEGDLTRRVDPESESEAMRAIGEAFNEMVADLERTVANVKGFAAHVSESTDRVNAGAEEVMEANDEVTAAAEEIADGAHTQTENLREVSEEMNTLSASAQEIAATVDEAADTSQRAADAGADGREAAEEALDQMDAIERETAATVEAIEDLEEEMEAIGEIVDVITEIADQTNLLAVNASIEAARTGQEGDGFAVVADEIQNLAEETKESAEEIEGRIERVQNRTAETVAGIRETSDRLGTGVETVENAIESLERIVELVEQIDTSVQEINAATEDQAHSSQTVVSMVDEVAEISERTTDQADDVASAARQQATTVSEMRDGAADVADRTATLTDLLDGFDVDGTTDVDVDGEQSRTEVTGDD